MNEREKRLGLITGAILVGGGLYVYAEPLVQRWNKVRVERTKVEEQLASMSGKASRLEALQRQRQELDVELRPPAERGAKPDFTEFVEDIAEEIKVSQAMTSVRFVGADYVGEDRKANKKGPFGVLRFQLRAQLTLEQTEELLVRLTASKRHVRISALDLVPQRNKQELDVTLTLETLVPRDVVAEELPK